MHIPHSRSVVWSTAGLCHLIALDFSMPPLTNVQRTSFDGFVCCIFFSFLVHQDKINFSVFPRFQGGPHNHTISAIATTLKQAQSPEFKAYQKQVIVYVVIDGLLV